LYHKKKIETNSKKKEKKKKRAEKVHTCIWGGKLKNKTIDLKNLLI
jgi:hypothetical protein